MFTFFFMTSTQLTALSADKPVFAVTNQHADMYFHYTLWTYKP